MSQRQLLFGTSLISPISPLLAVMCPFWQKGSCSTADKSRAEVEEGSSERSDIRRPLLLLKLDLLIVPNLLLNSFSAELFVDFSSLFWKNKKKGQKRNVLFQFHQSH